jgi:MFS transporter, MHS family, proline/betaine transporter
MSVANTQPFRGSYLMPSLDHASVADAMHPGILGCEPDTSLREVAQIMATHHVHCVAVIGISHEEPECGVWGVISDLELVRAGIRDADATTARTLADQPLVTVEPTVPLREAGELMLAHNVSHLVVIQAGTGRPIGILSTADVAGVIAWGEA